MFEEEVTEVKKDVSQEKGDEKLIFRGEFQLEDLRLAQMKQAQKRQNEVLEKNQQLEDEKNREKKSVEKEQDERKQDKKSLPSDNDSDYGSDQSVDKFEVDSIQMQKVNTFMNNQSLKVCTKQRSKRWSWWK